MNEKKGMNEMETKLFGINRSKSGLPTITECGGGMTNTGDSRIICGTRGERIVPLFVPKGYSNGDHAIFVAKPGMHIITASHDRSGETIRAWRMGEIVKEGEYEYVSCALVGEAENGDSVIPDYLIEAAAAANDKAHDYHCRRAWYASPK